MARTIFRCIAIGCAAIPLSAGLAHVFEMPNKLALDGPLWLAVQQQLYRGWGPIIAPFEVAAILAAWILAFIERDRPRTFRLAMLAAMCFTTMLTVFFAVNEPVNLAFAGWTPATLPADWPAYRMRWEIGHAAGCALALIGAVALLRTAYVDAADASGRASHARPVTPLHAAASARPRGRAQGPMRARTGTHNVVVPLRYRDPAH